ncbi:MAG: J domain-containing protein [Angelakisella sp.]
MTDPYKVLGIPSGSTDEQVKDAYRQLARKYHPDNYVNNPLSDLATEKMKEINEAYDDVQKQRKSGQSGGGYGGSYGSSGGYSGSSQFSDIRTMINNGRPAEAEELLDGVPTGRRDAEWYFLKGTIAYSRGWIDTALQHFTTACQKNPANQEYRAALNRLSYQRQSSYSPQGRYQGGGMSGGMSCCDLCATIYCANCCCDCMSGGC